MSTDDIYAREEDDLMENEYGETMTTGHYYAAFFQTKEGGNVWDTHRNSQAKPHEDSRSKPR